VNIRPPLSLFREGQLFGTIVTYSYETPWAEGWFEAVDQHALRAMIAACELLRDSQSWPDLASSEDDDARWEAAMERGGITEADLDRHRDGPWMIEMPDGSRHEIFLPIFDAEGFVTWRW
jgi:hypothetical protein